MQIETMTRDVVVDKYGDISFSGGDIVTTADTNRIAKDNAAHRIMSGFGDMVKYKLYGANLNSYIGRPISQKLVEAMKKSIEESLTEDLMFSSYNLIVTPVLDHDKAYFKISVGTARGFGSSKDQEINIVFSATGGVRYV